MDTLDKPTKQETEDLDTKEVRALKKQVAHFREKFQDADSDRNRWKARATKLERQVKNQRRALRGQSRKINDVVLGVMVSDATRKGTFSATAAEIKELLDQ